MIRTKDEAVRRIYLEDNCDITREQYLDEGFREEFQSQVRHFTAQQDLRRGSRFTEAITKFDAEFEVTELELAQLEAKRRRPTGRMVRPRVFLVGYSTANMQGIVEYLRYSGQDAFLTALREAAEQGVSAAEALISFFAKLCYKSLVVGENANITQVRDIPGNIKGAQDTAHGSIFEHIGLSFVVTDCSRVFTHEMVRHRVGVAYSQTSGRYCAITPGSLQLVLDPLLEGCEDLLCEAMQVIERAVYLIEVRKGLRRPPYAFPVIPAEACFDWYDSQGNLCHEVPAEAIKAKPEDLMWQRKSPAEMKASGIDFATKKKLTSAARRIAPNGQSNELGMTLNVRTLRHTIMMRTSRAAEWEIRNIFGQIYDLAVARWPLMFADAQIREVDGLREIYGMKMNPYERVLSDYEENDLLGELWNRGVLEGHLEVLPDGTRKVKPAGHSEISMEQATGGEVVPTQPEPEAEPEQPDAKD